MEKLLNAKYLFLGLVVAAGILIFLQPADALECSWQDCQPTWVDTSYYETHNIWVDTSQWEDTQVWLDTSHWEDTQVWLDTSHWEDTQVWLDSSHWETQPDWVDTSYDQIIPGYWVGEYQQQCVWVDTSHWDDQNCTYGCSSWVTTPSMTCYEYCCENCCSGWLVGDVCFGDTYCCYTCQDCYTSYETICAGYEYTCQQVWVVSGSDSCQLVWNEYVTFVPSQVIRVTGGYWGTKEVWVVSGFYAPQSVWVVSGFYAPQSVWVVSGFYAPQSVWVVSGYNSPQQVLVPDGYWSTNCESTSQTCPADFCSTINKCRQVSYYCDSAGCLSQLVVNNACTNLCGANETCSGGICVLTNSTLTVAKSGIGSGTITSNPSGINCGSTCAASYTSGTSVTLTAAPASGSIFAGWSGACSGMTCTLSMTAAKNTTASFGILPDTSIISNPAAVTNQTSTIFTFTGTNSPTSYQCKLDTGVWAVCVSPKSYTISQGNHTFQVKATNVFGTDLTPASYAWLIDTTLPVIFSFDVQPRTLNLANSTATISWIVTDSGGSYLNYVEVWRANYNTTNCSDTNKTGCSWIQNGPSHLAPANSNSWTSSATDSPIDGTYWYGLHVLDNAGNMRIESSPIKVSVSLNRPPDKPIPDDPHPDGDINIGVTWSNCSFQGKSIPTFHWIYSDPDGDPQSAYEIEADDNSSFAAPKFNHMVTSTAASYTLNLAQDDPAADWISILDWNTTYFWRVRVKDSKGSWSSWSKSDMFKTPKHAYGYPNFTWSPQDPTQKETVVFDPDASEVYGETAIAGYLWTIVEGTAVFTDDTSVTSRYPHIKFTSSENRIKLEITDTDDFSCESAEVEIFAQLPLPEYQEIPPN